MCFCNTSGRPALGSRQRPAIQRVEVFTGPQGHLMRRVRRLKPVDDVVGRALGLVESYEKLVRDELPDDAELFDAHVHLGTDIDGMRGDLEELLRIQTAHGITRSFMF